MKTSRRIVLAGMGTAAGAVACAQLIGSRLAFGAPRPAGDGAAGGSGPVLVVVSLRGGADGLSIVVPAFESALYTGRPSLAVPPSRLLPVDRGFGLHPALAPLLPQWRSGRMAAVPAVGVPGAGRSHLRARRLLDGGGTGGADGWVDRLARRFGPGGFHRAGTRTGGAGPASGPVAVVHEPSAAALRSMYADVAHPVADRARAALSALSTGGAVAPVPVTATYPSGPLSDGLREIAGMIRAGAGLRLATVEAEGWDLHAGMGGPDAGRMRDQLAGLAGALAAFLEDLGPAVDGVTVVVMTEFGRRVAENASGGTDHGTAAALLLLGGGINGGRVHGPWPGLSDAALDQGGLAGVTDYRDVLSELVRVRLGVGDTSTVFPGHRARPLGVCR